MAEFPEAVPVLPSAVPAVPEIPADTEAPASEPRRRSNPAYSRLNDALGVYVVACALLTAVPVALNRPQLWLIWVALTAFVALVYLGLGALIDRQRPLLSLRHKALFGLALVIPVYALVQSVPGLGGLVGGASIPEGMEARTISLMPDASQTAAVRFVGYILFAMLAIEVAGRSDRARRMGWWIFWGVVVHAVWALVALNLLGDINIWGGDKSAYAGFATGTFINRNAFATFLAMGSVLGLALLYEQLDKPVARKARVRSALTPERLDKLLVGVGLGLIAITLLSTGSRLGVVVAGLGTTVCYVMMRVKGGKSVWTAMLHVALAALALLALAFLAYGQDLLWRTLFLERNAGLRIDGYAQNVTLLAERPLLGYGFEAFRPAFEKVHLFPMNPDLLWDRAHSTYMTHWIELGVIVGSVPIVMGAMVALKLIAPIRARSRDYALSIAAFAALVVAATHSTLDLNLEMPANVILLLAILGLGLTHRQSSR